MQVVLFADTILIISNLQLPNKLAVRGQTFWFIHSRLMKSTIFAMRLIFPKLEIWKISNSGVES